jgi:thiazolinyl imide reductase
MKVIVCGTRFGQVYLEAFRNEAFRDEAFRNEAFRNEAFRNEAFRNEAFRDPASPYELAGILATGSQRSQACARRYGAPLYTAPDQLPADVDIACVVIRGGLLGGRGSQLAQELMARGIHVLQEHPLHHDELAECLRVARRHRVVYHLNAFYPHQVPVRRFVAAARVLLARRPARYVDAACGFQLAYSLLDILGEALGGVRPYAFGSPPAALSAEVAGATALDVPFRSVAGVLAGVPLTLRVQNQMDPADPDNYAHLMHRISIGTEAGNLTLVGTHGPVVWTARPDFPRAVADPSAAPHFDALRAGSAPPDSATVLGPAGAPSFDELFATVWPAGVVHALDTLRHAIETGADPLRRGQYHLTLCRLWQDLTLRLGPPDLVSAQPPRMLTGDELAELSAAADGVRPSTVVGSAVVGAAVVGAATAGAA